VNAAASTPSTRRRRADFGRVMLICAGLGAIAGAAAALLGALGLVAEPLAYGLAVLTAGVAALWFSYRWWQAVDEAVREAHKTSWFWGGSAGLVVVGAAALALYGVTQGDAAEQFGVTHQEAGLLLAGILFTVVTLLVGYGICWAGWWFTRSR
jgi:hypothetical protein